MGYYLDAPGGLKIPVQKEVVELMQRLGTPCKKVDKSNPFVENGFEYYYYQDDDGNFRTSIKKVQKEKHPGSAKPKGA